MKFEVSALQSRLILSLGCSSAVSAILKITVIIASRVHSFLDSTCGSKLLRKYAIFVLGKYHSIHYVSVGKNRDL